MLNIKILVHSNFSRVQGINRIINLKKTNLGIFRPRNNFLLRRTQNLFGFLTGLILVTSISMNTIQAQGIDILLKGGHVIDPLNKIDSQMDVAISQGKILKIASEIPSQEAKKVIDVTGMYVTPGLIDIHIHAFWGTNGDRFVDGPFAIQPDGFTFRCGVTTAVDAGSMGWRYFPTFKKQTIDQSKTRILAYLNIVGTGMRLIYESDTNDMDPQLTAQAALLYKDYVVGIKTAHFRNRGWTAVDRTIKAGRLCGMPVMIHFADINPPLPPLSLEDLLLKRLRSGDIYTHVYSADYRREHVVDKTGKVKPFVFEAQRKGIIFDVGFGAGSLSFGQLIPSMKQGFYPDIISTDMYSSSVNHSMKDMSNVMSMFLSLGMSIQDVILRTTLNPANAINRKELGNLSPGVEADIAVFKIVEGDYGFMDSSSRRFNGTARLQTELTLRAGRIVWNLNGLGSPMWNVDVKY